MDFFMAMAPLLVLACLILSLLFQLRQETKRRVSADNRAAKWEKMAGDWERAVLAQQGAIDSQKEQIAALNGLVAAYEENKREAETLCRNLQELADEREKTIELLKGALQLS